MIIIPADIIHPSLLPKPLCAGSEQPAEAKTWHGVWHGVCMHCHTPWKLNSDYLIPKHTS